MVLLVRLEKIVRVYAQGHSIYQLSVWSLAGGTSLPGVSAPALRRHHTLVASAIDGSPPIANARTGADGSAPVAYATGKDMSASGLKMQARDLSIECSRALDNIAQCKAREAKVALPDRRK